MAVTSFKLLLLVKIQKYSGKQFAKRCLLFWRATILC